jgi:hypothetical protein
VALHVLTIDPLAKAEKRGNWYRPSTSRRLNNGEVPGVDPSQQCAVRHAEETTCHSKRNRRPEFAFERDSDRCYVLIPRQTPIDPAQSQDLIQQLLPTLNRRHADSVPQRVTKNCKKW